MGFLENFERLYVALVFIANLSDWDRLKTDLPYQPTISLLIVLYCSHFCNVFCHVYIKYV